MRKYLLAFLLLFGSYGLFAQTANNYIFSTATGAALDPMTGATAISPADRDDGVSALQTIPFTFTYEGVAYTQLTVSCDGWVKLGSVAGVSQFSNSITSTTNIPKLFPMWDDLALGTNGTLSVLTTGTAPNRIYKVQWFLTIPRSTAGTANSTLQCWLYETTNVIEFRYGTAGTPASASVGINGATATNFHSVTTTSHTTSTVTANNTVAAWPGSGRMYTFTPPPPCAGTPSAPTIPASAGFCQPSGTVVLTGSNLPTGLGLNYQWEESDDNGVGDPWANAIGGTGATSTTYTSPTLTTGIYYRLKVTCSNSGLSSNSNACQITPVFCSFNVTRNATSFSSISATGTSMSSWRNANNTDDNLSSAQPIGFTFNYRGNNFTQFSASTNGYLTFNVGTAALGNGTGAYGYDNTQFSSTTGTLNSIAPFYEDQVTPGNPGTAAGLAAAIKYQLDGTAPNRVLTVEWIGMETFNNPGPNLNYQVKLYETTNQVEIVYGTIELFNGTANFGYSYTVGVNAATISASPTVDQLQSQQADNLQNFAPVAKNDLDRFIDCNVKYTFTPGTYGGAGTAPTLANDEPAGATTVGVNTSPCTILCGTYYTSNTATASAGIPVCSAATPGTPDDDVWFKFTATTPQQTITVRSGGGYDAVVQLFSDAGITSVTCVNATGAGLTETINATGLTPGNVYYIRIYHAGTGSNNAGAGTGNTTTGGVPDFSLCVNEVVPPPANDNPCGAHPLTIGAGSCNAYSDNTVGGKTQFVTATNTTVNGVVTPVCTGAGAAQDVWFSFVAPACGPVIIKTTPVAGVNTAFEVDSVVSGTCAGSDLVLGVKSCTNIASTGQIDSLSFNSFIPGNTYYVRVYHHPSGQGGAPVSNSQFSICIYTPPTPSCTTNNSPANAATNVSATPTLSWAAAPGAAAYDVYLDTNNPPTTLVTTVSGTSYTVSPALSYTTTYYWYVVPKNCSGSATGCSANTTSFTTANPPPANDECSGAITVTTQPNAPTCSGTTSVNTTSATLSTNTSACWSTSNNDDVWYRFVATSTSVTINVSNYVVTSGTAPDLAYVLYNDSLNCSNVNTAHELTTSCPVISAGGTGSGTGTFTGLIVGNTYTLRLFTSGSGNSASFDFCLMDPPLPPSCTTNLTPANGATNQVSPITLSWNAAATATSYTVFIGTSNPPTAADSLTTVSGTSVILANAASNTTYYWFVTPKNAGGAASGCSSNTTSFTTGLIYCIPVYTNNVCVSGDSLTYFSLKGEDGTQIINASGGACTPTTNYTSYTGLGTVDLAPSKSYSGKLKVNPGFSEGISMWIDFNDNGLFEGTEKVLNHITVAPADGQLLYSIYIPIGSAAGNHRLRVRTVFGNAGANIDPCTSYGYGETEDYLVNILAATPTYVVSTPPAPGTCITAGVTTIDSLSNNRNVVLPLVDSLNNIVASVNALNQNLGRVTTQYYLHNSNNGANTRQDAISGAPPVPAYYLDRNLRISVATQPATPVNVRMYVSAADLANYNVAVPSTAIGNLNVHKTNQNFCATQAAGDSAYIAATGSGTLGTDYFVDFSSPSFSNFYLFRGAAVLPVSITGLSAKATGSTNTVYWTTQQEQNNQKFVVERSANGRNFTAIGEVNSLAPNGNSSSPLNYQFVDAQPLEGKSYYRLQQVDRGGEKRQTPVVTVLRGKGQLEIVDVRPNPTNGKLYFNVIGGGNSALTVVVRSLNGSEVLRQNLVQGGNFSIDLNGVANGMYILEAMNRDGEKAQFKVVKQ